MSESPQYEAFRAFARAEMAHLALQTEIRLKETLTREAPKIVEGPPGKDGKDGANGVDGQNGIDGKHGERGADGIMTRQDVTDLHANLQTYARGIIEAHLAEVQVRTFADIYTGVYKPGESYTRGVLTTWGGSLWLSLNDTKAKPGENPDWRLVVKK